MLRIYMSLGADRCAEYLISHVDMRVGHRLLQTIIQITRVVPRVDHHLCVAQRRPLSTRQLISITGTGQNPAGTQPHSPIDHGVIDN